VRLLPFFETPNAEAPGDFWAKRQEGTINANDRIPEEGAADRTEPTPREDAALHQRACGIVREVHPDKLNLLVEVDFVQAQLRSGHRK
jgi:hypothetical protein